MKQPLKRFGIILHFGAHRREGGMNPLILVSFQSNLLQWIRDLIGQGYRVRTHAEEYQFFQKGRVFAMLWSEPAGETTARAGATDNSRYTTHPNSGIVEGRFGQKIYCQIRRFVVIRVNRQQHFVEAWYVACDSVSYPSDKVQCDHDIWQPRGFETWL